MMDASRCPIIKHVVERLIGRCTRNYAAMNFNGLAYLHYIHIVTLCRLTVAQSQKLEKISFQ